MITNRHVTPARPHPATTDGLAAFLRARLDEDAAAAHQAEAAAPSPWRTSHGGNLVHHEHDGPVAYCWAHQAGDHIARYDPARVVADILIKRLLIECWDDLQLLIDATPDATRRARITLTRHGFDVFAMQLATLYSDHPDYQPPWAP